MDREQLLKRYLESSTKLERAKGWPMTVCGVLAGAGLIPPMITGAREVLVSAFGLDRSLAEGGSSVIEVLIGAGIGGAYGNRLDRASIRRERKVMAELEEKLK